MKPLFDHYRSERPVYSLDLPGFGSSERSDRVYSPELFSQVIHEFITTIVQGQSPGPVDLVSFSLSTEFSARAVLADPQMVNSMVFISPTGMSVKEFPSKSRGEKIRRVLSKTPWGDGIYRLLTNKLSIRYFLNRNFVTDVPQEMVDYAYLMSRQPGAKHAPFYFLSGQLFTTNACQELYEKLTTPVLILYDQDPNVSFDLLPDLLSKHNNWSVVRIKPTLGIPQWEQQSKTFAALDAFWEN
jgi:pimeloyl-ACP methyl ester carboxylesterase